MKMEWMSMSVKSAGSCILMNRLKSIYWRLRLGKVWADYFEMTEEKRRGEKEKWR